MEKNIRTFFHFLFVFIVMPVFFLAPVFRVQAAASTFIVNTVDDHDDGVCDINDCTLREAIIAANAHPNDVVPDRIQFNILSGCDSITKVCKIAPVQPLPDITEQVTMDGYTQPGASVNTLTVGNNAKLLIEISGENIVNPTDGIVLSTSGNLIRGLVVNRFTWNGINIHGYANGGGNNTLQGNYIGTDPTGMVNLGNDGAGIYIDFSAGNIVGGAAAEARNVISGNHQKNILVYGETSIGNVFQGNYIGTNSAGSQSFNTTPYCLSFNNASSNTVGGITAGAGNLISCQLGTGIEISGTKATGNLIQGNFIGTSPDGTARLGNVVGVYIDDAPSNIIGGTVAGAGNLISGNTNYGVQITKGNALGNRVQGNYIGTNVSGSGSIANGESGVMIDNYAYNNTIGGTETGARNLISGNTKYGVSIDSASNFIQGNYIGADITGANSLGNGLDGIYINGPDNVIGGTVTGAGNLIAWNNRFGVFLNSSTGNQILENAIFTNGDLGIAIDNNGVTHNDLGDSDAGTNNQQNFPILTSLSGNALSGVINSTTNSEFRIEFYANTSCDPSGYGEGEQFLGALNSVMTDSYGNAGFVFTFSPVNAKPYITATATKLLTGDTSEFSPCFPYTPPYTTTTTVTALPAETTYRDAVTFRATVTTGDQANPYAVGQVQFKDGTSDLSTPIVLDINGQATFTTSGLSVGTHAISAEFFTNEMHSGSTGGLTFRVSRASSSLQLTASDSYVNAPTTVTATVMAADPGKGIPGGTVTFYDGGLNLATVSLSPNGVNAAQAVLSTSTLPEGAHNLSATYNGDENFNISTGSTSMTVRPSADVSLSMTSSPAAIAAYTPLTIHLTASNQGPSQASNVVIQAVLPPGLVFRSASVGCVQTNLLVTCHIGTLNPNTSNSVTIEMLPPMQAAGHYSFSASISSDTYDPVNNQTASLDVLVAPRFFLFLPAVIR